MEKLKIVLPANRIAVIVAVLTSLAVALPGIAEAFVGVPSVQAVILSAVGVLGAVLPILKFLDGSQKFDELQQAPVAYDPFVYNNEDESLSDETLPDELKA